MYRCSGGSMKSKLLEKPSVIYRVKTPHCDRKSFDEPFNVIRTYRDFSVVESEHLWGLCWPL